VNRNCPY